MLNFGGSATRFLSLSVLISSAVIPLPLAAQDAGAEPIARTHPGAEPLSQIATLIIPDLDRAACARDDIAREANGLQPRFAMPHQVTVTPATHGTWQVLDDTWSLWRLRVQAPGASHVNLGFTRFRLPLTAQLMVYNADYSHVQRPFDARDHSPSGDLWTPVVLSDEIVIELHTKTADRGLVALVLGQVNSGYRFFGAGPTAIAAEDTHCPLGPDVVCPDGNPWRAETAAIALLTLNGVLNCTGFSVNNTAQDSRNFLMTAYHCGITPDNASTVVAYWNYQNSLCGGTDDGSLSQFTSGATYRAGYEPSDFTLLEMNSPPDPNWDITYAGWSRGGADANSAVGIHHPSGFPKKICFENDPTRRTSLGETTSPGDGTHILVDWDLGVTAQGSSGSPLFDQNHRVIGQLWGGVFTFCGFEDSNWYGSFAVSWTGGGTDSTRLSTWLDPQNTGALFVDTLSPSLATAIPFGSGCYRSFATFFEDFSFGTFDLSPGFLVYSILLTPNGTGFTVTPGPRTWFQTTSGNLWLADDDVSRPLLLPFSFQHPGGTTTRVRMCSNGYIWLDGTSTFADYSPTRRELVDAPARLFPLWMDLDPDFFGTTHFDVDPSGDAVYLTWLGVAEFDNPFVENNIQCVIRANGEVEFRWSSVENFLSTAIVGYSPGSRAQLPTSVDISASMPFDTNVDSRPLTLTPRNFPVLGTSFSLNVENIPANSFIGALFFGSRIGPGLDLGLVGMAGCLQYCSLDGSVAFAVTGATTPLSVEIPNDTALAGLGLSLQAATLTPLINTLGVLASNGVDIKANPK
jgi:hypothetical protein